LGTQIKRRRDRAGWTQTEFAEKIRFSLDTVKSVETGRLFASEPFAEAADQAFVADGDLIELREYLERASMRPWFRDRMIMEQKAVDIWEYEPYVVSGLLQTESYMRAVASGERPSVPDNEIDERVELRLRRQRYSAGTTRRTYG